MTQLVLLDASNEEVLQRLGAMQHQVRIHWNYSR